MRVSIRFVALIPIACGVALSAAAGELTSSSFRLQGSHFNALGSAGLPSSGPRFSDSGVALGQGDALGWTGGTAGSLTTVAPGFWPIVAGDLPTLDVDGDGIASWLDDDDDGDGLLDAVETGTGVFASPTDTGTSAVDPDSDGDGASDGAEVAAGTDPTDPGSMPPAVPALPLWAFGATALALAWSGRLARRFPQDRSA